MNKVNSEKASNAVADVLEELGFKNYIVLVGNKNTEEVFDAIVTRCCTRVSAKLHELSIGK